MRAAVPYVLLTLAIAAEVFATSMLKLSDGFSRLWPSLGVAAGYLVAFALLAQTVRALPVSVVYAVWSGLGTVGIVAIGAMFLGEPLGLLKLLGIGLVVGGVVLLNLGGAH